MSRYTGPACKKCQKLSQKLYLKGSKCYNNCPVERQQSDKHFAASGPRGKMSDYGKHLREKQIARFSAGMSETQFHRFFVNAAKTPGGTGETFMRYLEIRLDNIVRRLGFAISLSQARQLVSHGHISVNGRCVNIPSYLLKVGDEITISPKMLESVGVKQGMEHAEKVSRRPSFLTWDSDKNVGKLVRMPDRAESSIQADDQLIIEYYSK